MGQMPSIKPTTGSKKHISLDDVCFLVSRTFEQDELGQEIPINSERQVFCSSLSITRAEFSLAGQLGLKPNITIVVDHDEYDEEETVKWHDKTYSVYKNFVRNDGYIELYCEVRAGG